MYTFDKHLLSAIQKKITDSVNNIGLRDASASKNSKNKNFSLSNALLRGSHGLSARKGEVKQAQRAANQKSGPDGPLDF